MYKNGTPTTLTVSIRNTTSYYPTGGDLTSGTFDSTTVSETSSPGGWYEINVTPYTLTDGALYGIIFRVPGGDASNLLAMRSDSSSPTYSGGQFQRSTDSGVTWNSYNYTTIDGMFEVWGAAAGVATKMNLTTPTRLLGRSFFSRKIHRELKI